MRGRRRRPGGAGGLVETACLAVPDPANTVGANGGGGGGGMVAEVEVPPRPGGHWSAPPL